MDAETRIFSGFLIVMAVYYAFRMFALTPWYDELYTYYYFISRGPVYAAIHWPLPNNHVGYSVLSAFLMIFQNPAIALRGVSWLCSIGNLILLYRIGTRVLSKGVRLLPAVMFAGLSLINQLAVQGRGYALVTFCCLTALWELLRIAEEEERRQRYLLFGLALLVSLWAIPSSVYMVLPICLTGGFLLILSGKRRKLLHLIAASVLSAVGTAALYSVLWLAIGSNLLCKGEESGFFGMGHFQVLRKAPLQAWKTGVDYMLASPYIQSVEREGFLSQLREWLKILFGSHLTYLTAGGSTVFWAIVLAAAAVLGLYELIKRGRNKLEGNGQECLPIYFLCSLILLPGMLMLQCKLPYYRVFSFAGVLLALSAAWLMQWGVQRISATGIRRAVCWIGTLSAMLLCILSLSRGSEQYSIRDALLSEVYDHMPEEVNGKIAVTDCDQEYLLFYQCGIGEEGTTRSLEEAELVVFDRYLLGADAYAVGYDAPEQWKMYMTREQVPEKYLDASAEIIYENEYFVLFQNEK